MVQPRWRTFWQFLIKSNANNMTQPFYSLDTFPREMKTGSNKDLHTNVNSSLIHNSKNNNKATETTQVCINR